MLNSVPSSNSYHLPVPAPQEIRMLLLDDSNFDRARIRRLSAKTNLCITLDEVDSISKLSLAVSKVNYDVILIDYRLPIGDGLDALNLILENDLNKDAGKIMITGNGAVKTAVSAMQKGCHDFLTKEEMNADALGKAIVNALEAAGQHQQAIRQADYQREIIRQGLVAAMQDREVQGNVISLVQNHQKMTQAKAKNETPSEFADPAEMEALLADFQGEDDFIFH